MDTIKINTIQSEFYGLVSPLDLKQKKAKGESVKMPALPEPSEKSKGDYLKVGSSLKAPALYVTAESMIQRMANEVGKMSEQEQAKFVRDTLYPLAKSVSEAKEKLGDKLPGNIFFAICKVFCQTMNLQSQDELQQVNLMQLQQKLMGIQAKKLENLSIIAGEKGGLPRYKQDLYDDSGHLIHKKGDIVEYADLKAEQDFYDKTGLKTVAKGEKLKVSRPKDHSWKAWVIGGAVIAAVIGAAVGIGAVVGAIAAGSAGLAGSAGAFADAAGVAAVKTATYTVPAVLSTGPGATAMVARQFSSEAQLTQDAQAMQVQSTAIEAANTQIQNGIQLSTKRMTNAAEYVHSEANYIQQAITDFKYAMGAMAQRA